MEQTESDPNKDRTFKTIFEIRNEHSEKHFDLNLTDRKSSFCITADQSFKARLEAEFKREYQNVEFQFCQRPGLNELACTLSDRITDARQLSVFFLVTKLSEKNVVDPDHVVLALTRLRDFLIEKRI